MNLDAQALTEDLTRKLREVHEHMEKDHAVIELLLNGSTSALSKLEEGYVIQARDELRAMLKKVLR